MSILADLSAELQKTVEAQKGRVYMVGDNESGWRSGVLVNADEIITIARWADDGEAVPVTTPSGEQKSATVKGFDLATGLTLLVCEGVSGEKLGIPEHSPSVGHLSVTVGYPSPEGHEAVMGMVRCVGSRSHDGAYFQTDGATFPGFEGGIVSDTEGLPFGIVGRSGRRRDDFIIPLETVLEKAAQLREHGSTTTGFLGVRTESVDAPKGVDSESALLVVGVEADSPADSGGVLVGDILISAGGKSIQTHEELMTVLSSVRPSEELELGVLRGGERETIRVTPGRRRPGHGHHHHHRGRRGRRRP